MRLNYLTIVLAVALISVEVFQFRALPWTPLRLAGAVLLLPSSVLFVLARVQLGRAFSIRAKADMLVTHGLYARIRNPIYVFGSLATAGFMLWINRPLLLLVFVVIVPVQIYRSRQEERVLTERFGNAYLNYKRGTWF